ncbi:Segregation and condensation protein A [uncultured archaeon]|nr:Segregation and condensation protein A [uncultured archaeon]
MNPVVAECPVKNEDLANLAEATDESIVALPEKIDLVDLIEQPAWKAILVELVRRERMDPWHIDIAELAGKYLAKINTLSGTDLRLPANAILASAILLRFKADILRLSEIEDEEEFIEKKKSMSVEERTEFEALLPDLKNIRRIKEGKVTIDELVSSIERMLQTAKRQKDKGLFRRERTKFILPFSDFDIDSAMEKTLKRIERNADSQGLVVFSRIIKDPEDTQGIVRTFIPCLFLTNKGKINMWQEIFFGEIFLSLNSENQGKGEETKATKKVK